MSIRETGRVIKWITIGFAIALVCCVIAAIVDSIPVFDRTYGDLLFITFFPRVFLVIFIIMLGGMWLTRRARVKIGIYILIGGFLTIGLFLGFSFLEYNLFEILGDLNRIIRFELELIGVLFLSIILSAITFNRWKKTTAQSAHSAQHSTVSMENSYANLKRKRWMLFFWMVLVCGIIHLGISIVTPSIFMWILILVFGPLVLTCIFDLKLRRIVLQAVKKLFGRLKSLVFRFKNWIRAQKESAGIEEIGGGKGAEKSKLLYIWSGCVRIIRLPGYIEQDQIASLNADHPSNSTSGLGNENPTIWENVRYYETWLQDYLSIWHVQSCFTEFLCGEGIEIRIGTYTDSQQDAQMMASEIQRILAQNFPSMETTLEVKQILHRSDMIWDGPLARLVLSKPPYPNPLSLIRNISQLATKLTSHHGGNEESAEINRLRVVIHHEISANSDELGRLQIRKRLQQIVKSGKKDAKTCERIGETWNSGDLFKINVYYQVLACSTDNGSEDGNESVENTRKITKKELKRYGNSLITNIVGLDGSKPRLTVVTGLDLRKVIRGRAVRLATSTLINPLNSGFHFMYDFPLQRTELYSPSQLVTLADLGYNPAVESLEKWCIRTRTIILGTYYKGNVLTTMRVPFHIDISCQHISVFGLTRTGKSTFLGNFVQKIGEIDDRVTFLIIGLKDDMDRYLFQPCILSGYPDPNFRVPICTGNLSLNAPGSSRERMEMARLMSAAFGLLDNMDNYILNYLSELDKKGLPIPTDFVEMTDGVIDYLERTFSGTENQSDILQAVKNHVNSMQNPRFLEIVKPSKETPEWFRIWLKGGEKSGDTTSNSTIPSINGVRGSNFYAESKRIFLDLHQFSEPEQKFLTLAISNMIRRYAKPQPHTEQRLRRMVIVDEAHIVFSPPDGADYLSSHNIRQSQIMKYLDKMVDQLGNTGTSFVFSDQNLKKVMGVIVDQTSTKWMFRVSQASAELYTKDARKVDLLKNLANHRAIMLSFTKDKGFTINALVKMEKPPDLPIKDETNLVVPDDADEVIQADTLTQPKEITEDMLSAIPMPIVKDKDYMEEFELKIESLWDRLVELHRIYPILDKDRENLAKVEDFWRKGKKDVIAVINACEKTIEVYHMPLSDKYNHTLVESLNHLEEFLDTILDVRREKGEIILTKQQFRRACRWIDRIDLDFHFFYEEMVGIEEELIKEESASGNFDFDDKDNEHALRSSISRCTSQPKSTQIQQNFEKPEPNDKFNTQSNEMSRDQANDPTNDSVKDPSKELNHTKNQREENKK